MFNCHFQRLAIELFRQQTSRSSSPPDLRLAAGPVSSVRDPHSVKSEDDIQTTLPSPKEGEEEDKTRQDESNVREMLRGRGPNPDFIDSCQQQITNSLFMMHSYNET